MYIAEQSPTILRLETNNIFYPAGLCLQAVLTCGVLFYAVFTMETRSLLECRRIEPQRVNCTVNSSTFIGLNNKVKTITNPQFAKVEDDGDDSYHVVLTAQHDSFRLNYGSARSGNAYRAQQINDFLRAPETESLTIKHKMSWLEYLLVAFVAAFMLRRLLKKQTLLCLFDRERDRLTIRTHNILGTQTIEGPLDQIALADVVRKRDDEGDVSYETFLCLSGKRKIPIFSSTSEEDSYALADTIHQFVYADSLVKEDAVSYNLREQCSGINGKPV